MRWREARFFVGGSIQFPGNMFSNLGQIILLLWATLRAVPQIWHERRKVLEQLFEIGNASLFMACLLSLFIGGVLALQTGPILVERGLGGSLGGLIGLSLCKELAPVMMAILMAGRVGSAMTAEIGSMQVYQEIDALRMMNLNPIHYLVLPRVVAIVVGLPCLVVFANLAGWLGGALVSAYNVSIDVSFPMFFGNLRELIESSDLIHGLVKSACFALIVGIVACHQGLTTRGGPRGIGRSVTKSVVNALVLILMTDYVITRILLAAEKA